MSYQKLSVFISYASEDYSHAKNIASVLTQAGFAPWLDKERLIPGQDWDLEINKAVHKADAIVLCISNRSKTKRGYVQKEIRKALDVAEEQPEGSIFLIPARLEPCEVPFRLHSWQWVDIYQENGLDQLVKALKMKAMNLAIPVIPIDVTDPIVGQYKATGNNADGSEYSGKVIISPQDGEYLVTWYIADDHFEAVGTLEQDKFTVSGDFEFSYSIIEDGRMSGEWEENAFEELRKIKVENRTK